FFGRVRSTANSSSMNEIAGFHNSAVEGSNSDGKAASLNNSASGETELGPEGDQKVCASTIDMSLFMTKLKTSYTYRAPLQAHNQMHPYILRQKKALTT
ncbi:hypothetical protein TSMEX_007904, partial [Taenia solium]